MYYYKNHTVRESCDYHMRPCRSFCLPAVLLVPLISVLYFIFVVFQKKECLGEINLANVSKPSDCFKLLYQVLLYTIAHTDICVCESSESHSH